MPTPKKYANHAERQAAYRQRLGASRKLSGQAQGMSKQIPAVPGRRRWEAMRNQCLCILDAAISEMEAYSEQRADAWHDSERGEAFTEMMESMSEITQALRDIDIR